MGQSVYIEHVGCSRRGLDASKFKHYFLANGFVVTKSPEKADYILLISCAFRKIEEDYSIKRIRELNRYKAKLIVGGCLKGINKERLYENIKGPAFITSNNKSIDKLFLDFKLGFSNIPDSNIVYPKNKFRTFRQYFFAVRLDLSYLKRLKICWERRVSAQYRYLRISWGCSGQHCSFCLIWRAVGKLKSKPIEVCIAEFKRILEHGCKNIILTADNLGIYGLDINLTFPDLLAKLLEVDGDYNIDFEEFHPFWLIEYLDRLTPLLPSGKIRSITCPIQSGSDRILKLMNRRHSKFQLKEALLKMKHIYPELLLHTTVILGFPSETEEEFEETLDFIREMDFELVYIFGYSKNPYLTNHEIISQEVPGETIRVRLNKTIKFCKKHGIACATA